MGELLQVAAFDPAGDRIPGAVERVASLGACRAKPNPSRICIYISWNHELSG